MLKANLFHTDTYKGADLDKLNHSLPFIETTINGDKFKNAVLNFKSFEFVKYKCFLGRIIKTTKLKEYANDELYQALMKGHRQEGSDSFMDLKLQISEVG